MDATACPARTGATLSYAVPMYDQCASWKTTPTVKLSLYVNGDCSITIKPIGDPLCADPGAVDGENPLAPMTTAYDYTYNDLVVRAYYASTTSIRTLLPSTDGGARCALDSCVLVSFTRQLGACLMQGHACLGLVLACMEATC